MSVRSLLAGGVMLLIAGLRPALAQDAGGEPFKLVRTLQALQDQIVKGDEAARSAQGQMIALTAKRLLTADPKVWQDPRNTRAAVAFVLIGGNPAVLRKLQQLGDPVGVDATLVKAALAHSSGKDVEAKTLWAAIDVRALPPSLAGPAALVQATLVMDQDPKKAVELLDFARLEAPGMLVEEAALRREIAVVSGMRDLEKFRHLSAEYIHRFPKSAYGAGFRQQFAQAVVLLGGPSAPDLLNDVEPMLDDVAAEDRRDVYLMIARLATRQANVAMARSAADHAAALSEPGSVEAARSSLYDAAALVVTDADGAVQRLAAVDAAKLPAPDAELRSAVLALAEEVRRWPETPAAAPTPPSGAGEAPPADASAGGIEHARQAMAETDQLLARATQ
jgi:chemotaxis protein MotC